MRSAVEQNTSAEPLVRPVPSAELPGSVESARLLALTSCAILDTPPEAEFDRITALAAQLLAMPIAVITFIDAERQWFKSRVGLEIAQTPRAVAFCALVVERRATVVVADAQDDPRFERNPLVWAKPFLRFYAGTPLRLADGHTVGTLAVMDLAARQFGDAERATLERLAALVVAELELRRQVESLRGPRAPAAELSRVPAERSVSKLLEKLPAILWTTDKSLRVLSAAGAGLAALTSEAEHKPGDWLGDLLGNEGTEHLAAHHRALAGESVSYEGSFAGREYATRIEPLHDAEGHVVGCIGVSLDITREKRAVRELASSEARFHLLTRVTRDLIWDLSVDGGVVAWSEAIYSQWGYAREQVGHDVVWWTSRIHPDDRERVASDFDRALASGEESWSQEYRFLRGDGSCAEVYDRGVIVRDEAGRAIRAVGILIDMSESNRLRRRVVESERLAALGTLAAGVAHEMNNPLSYALANLDFARQRLELVQRALPAGELQDELNTLSSVLADATQGAWRAANIVKDLKGFARSEDGHKTRGDVRRAMTQALRMLGRELAKVAELDTQLGPVPHVLVSEERLIQVFSNFLTNAVQAIDSAGAAASHIRIRTWTSEDGWAVAEVRDSGAGIPLEDRSKIFDPFFTTKPLGVGTGLGLSVCHSIVLSAGGRIEFDSELGQGTAFRMLLPPALGGELELEHESRPSTPGGLLAARPSAGVRRGRVLIIDDEPAVCRALARVLSAEFETMACTSGEDALGLLAEDRAFDVVLCDVSMPGKNGADVLAWLQRHDRALARRLVFMTGGAHAPELSEQLARFPNVRVAKPFDSEALLRTLQHVSRTPPQRGG